MSDEGVRVIDRVLDSLVWTRIRSSEDGHGQVDAIANGLEKVSKQTSGRNRMQRLVARANTASADAKLLDAPNKLVELVWAQLVVDGYLRSKGGDVSLSLDEISKDYGIVDEAGIRLLRLAAEVAHAVDEACDEFQRDSDTKVSWDVTESIFLEIYDALFDLSSSWEAVDDDTTRQRGPVRAPERKPGSKGNIDWVALGFQGTDPSTDFRGTGTFGLGCFSQLCTKYSQLAQQLVVESGSLAPSDKDAPWYSLALVSIHISMFLLTMMREQRPALIRYFLHTADLSDCDTSSAESASTDAKRQMALGLIKDLHAGLLMAFHRHWERGVSRGEIDSVLVTERELDLFYTAASRALWSADIAPIMEPLSAS